MKFLIERVFKGAHYTIGKMYVDYEDERGYATYISDTLEDKVREPFVKVYGSTAIREGDYKFILDFSKRFKKIMPHILDVEDFEGIRIHSGNTNEDTYGCLLLGYNKVKGKVISSTIAYNKFRMLLYSSKQNEWKLKII